MWPDFKYAVRTLQRSPRNTAIAAAILALAIGINTAMFSGINHVLLRPLPFPDADRLVRLRDEITDANGLRHPFNMSSRSFTIASNAADAFDEVVAMSGENMTLVAQSGGELPERVSVVRQSAGVDRVLGVHPAMGRTFSAAEEAEGEHSGVALVSHSLWQTRLGGTDAVLGSRIQLDDRAFTVVGVMPPAYAFPYHAQVWIPFTVDPADQSRDFAVWAHLKPGVTERQMGESLDRTAARVRQAQTTGGTYRIEVMTLRDNLIGSQDAPLRALSAIVAFLLLIACVNVATLLLASAVSRRREFAIRAALGASRARQIRQVFFETLLLAAMGCLAGVLLAAWIAPLTARLMPAVFVEELGLVQPHTDWRVAAFAAAAGVFSALLAALLPAFGASLTEPQSAILEQTRSATMGRSGRRLLGALVIAEGAFTVVLLAGAGLVVNNFVRLQAEPLGFDAKRLLTAELVPPEARYAAGPPRAQLLPAILERVRAEPGVVRAAATTVNPLGGGTWGAPVITEEAEARDPGAAVNVNHRLITPGLFATMGIPLLRGRDFTPQDRRGSPMVVIVSERMAHRLWPNQDPIGRRIRIARAGQPWLTVVGVAGDVADSHFPEVPKETWYVPYDQHAQTGAAEHVYLMVRTAADPLPMFPAVQRAVARVDRTLAPYAPEAMDAYRAGTMVRERVSAAFMLGFGAFGLGLAALGMYGVMAFIIHERTMELAIRMALGATAGDILTLVVKGSGALIAAGVAAGAAGAAVFNRMLAIWLPQEKASGALDLRIVAGAAALVAVAAAAACLAPATLAARVGPAGSLRSE